MSEFIPLPHIELKKLFIKNYDIENNNIKIKNIGIPIVNLNDSSCFFISAINLIARMQYVIYNEIKNLVGYEEIIALNEKITRDECLSESEVKQFNKYLLIQTIIELFDSDVMSRIEQLIIRLGLYLFIKNEFAYDTNQNNMFMSIVDKIHDYYKYFKSSPIYKEISNKIKKFSQGLIFQYYTLYAFEDYPFMNEEFYVPTLNILNQIARQLSSIENANLPHNLVKIEDLVQMMNRLNNDDKFTEEDFNSIQAVFSDTRCSNIKLKEFEKNLSLINIFGVGVEEINEGNDPNIVLKKLLNDITAPTNYRIINNIDNLNNVKNSLTNCVEPYVFMNLRFDIKNLITGVIQENNQLTIISGKTPRTQIPSPINFFTNQNNYNLGGILYTCSDGPHSHSAVSLQYSFENSITSREHTLINDDKKYPLELYTINSYLDSNKGRICSDQMQPVQLLYESQKYYDELKKEIYSFVSNTNNSSASASVDAVVGGAILNNNDYYKNKYLKYKAKYLNLKINNNK